MDDYGSAFQLSHAPQEFPDNDGVVISLAKRKKRITLLLMVAVSAFALFALISGGFGSRLRVITKSLSTVDRIDADSTLEKQELEIFFQNDEYAGAEVRTRETNFMEQAEEMELEEKTVILTYEDFLGFSSVRRWLKNDVGLDLKRVHLKEIKQYLPSRVEVFYRRKLIRGRIGADAEEGYVAFDLTYYDKNSSNYTSSLFIVMSLNGTLNTVKPTTTVGSHKDLHFCGLKLISPTEFLLGGNTGSSEFGPQYIFNWENEKFTELANGASLNCHDVQLAYTEDAVWSPGNVNNILETNLTTGDNVMNFSLGLYAYDINHLGLIFHDSLAFVSSRLTNAIIKVNMLKKEIDWIAGGENGTFEVETLSGEVMEAGTSLFVGQHNAEYFGDDEYYMFDNQYDMANASRMLIVEISEQKGRLKEVWEYEMAPYPWGNTPVFGDCDRLPTENILGSFWPSALSGAKYENILFETRIVEVERSTKEVAWQVDIYGDNHCVRETCEREYEGWKVYSVERFYVEPLVYDIRCNEKMLHFKTQNGFKQNNDYSGRYFLRNATSGNELTSGRVTWTPYWKSTEVHVDIETLNITGTYVELSVINQFKRVTKKLYQC